jgi:hypothetical protein
MACKTLLALCAQEVESTGHLIVGCVFAREVWFRILGCFGWQALAPANPVGFAAWWLHARKRVVRQRHKAFDSLVTLVAWRVWHERNERVFHSTCNLLPQLVGNILAELDCWCRVQLVNRSHLGEQCYVFPPRVAPFGPVVAFVSLFSRLS